MNHDKEMEKKWNSITIKDLMDILKNIDPNNSVEFINMGKNGYTPNFESACAIISVKRLDFTLDNC